MGASFDSKLGRRRVTDPGVQRSASITYPGVAGIPSDLPGLQVAEGAPSVDMIDYLAGMWRAWMEEMRTKYPTVYPLLGVLVSNAELRETVIGIRGRVSETLQTSQALFTHADKSPEAREAALSIVRELVTLRFQMFLAGKEAEFESNCDPKTRLLTGNLADKYLERLVLVHNVPTSIMTCDAKGLGNLNTALGQLLTDKVMGIIFANISSSLRGTDVYSTPFRRQAGGDEGIFVLPGIRDLKGLAVVYDRLQQKIGEPIELNLDEVTARSLEERLERLSAELATKGEAAKKKVEGAVKILKPIVEQIKSAREAEATQIRINFTVDMRFSAMMLTPGRFKEGFVGDARRLLELIEEQAKAVEVDHKNPCIVYNPDTKESNLISSGTIAGLEKDQPLKKAWQPLSNQSDSLHDAISESYTPSSSRRD